MFPERSTSDGQELPDERRRAAQSWILRVFACWALFQLILLGSVLGSTDLDSFRPATISSKWLLQVVGSPCAILIVAFAAVAAISAWHQRSHLRRFWIVLGCLPWGIVTVEAGVCMAFLVANR